MAVANVDVSSDVSTPCPEYSAVAPRWKMIADVLEGSHAVKAAGNDYIPPLSDHASRPDMAKAYIDRACFVDYTGRTVDALVGAIFRKEVGITVPKAYEPRLANVNNAGDQLFGFSKKVTREVITMGRYGILVDVPSTRGIAKSALDFLPSMAGYPAASIINWRTRNTQGQNVLDQVILREARRVPQEFGSKSVMVYRVLELDKDGLYFVRLYEEAGSGWTVSERVYPTSATGNPLDFLPFTFISPVDLSPEIARSPILGLAEANLAHYRASADLEQGRHFTSQPTPVIMGVTEDQQAAFRLMQIGSSHLWLMPPSVTDVKMLEYTGQGLGSLENSLVEKAQTIAMLGARLLESPKLAAEAAETVRLRNAGETSVLASIARTVSDGLKTAIEMSCRWAAIPAAPGAVEIELNQDFIDTTMDPTMLTALLQAYQAGVMPMSDLHHNLARGELLRPGSTLESYRDEIDMEAGNYAAPAMRLIRSEGGAAE
jgi:hypothetical protein